MKVLFLFLILVSNSLFASLSMNCEVSQNSCNAYLCLEGSQHCGIKGYYLGYAYKYCERFSKKTKKFSPKGQKWLRSVKSCLQKNAVETSKKINSCKKIKKNAFKGHVPCYIEGGFCKLPFKDKFKIMKTVYDSILKPRTLLPGFKILRKCYMSNNRYGYLDHYRLLHESGTEEDFMEF